MLELSHLQNFKVKELKTTRLSVEVLEASTSVLGTVMNLNKTEAYQICDPGLTQLNPWWIRVIYDITLPEERLNPICGKIISSGNYSSFVLNKFEILDMR